MELPYQINNFQPDISVNEAYAIIKALKIYHNTKITDLIQISFPEFYHNVNRNEKCDTKTLRAISKKATSLNLSFAEQMK